MWVLQKQLKQQAEEERALAQAEREMVVAKVTAAEQAALHSFIVAVFDIFGHLVWRTSCHDDEPRLCFADEPNAALDELLQQGVAGKSLEVLLGKPHDEELWKRERQRLWEYAALEAASEDICHEANAHIVARKIGLTCTDASNTAFEIELFIRPGSAGSVIYGILVLHRGHPGVVAEAERSVSIDRGEERYSGVYAGSRSSGSSVSSRSSGIELLLPIDDSTGCVGEVFAWVDAAGHGLPILKCSAGFTLISGPSSSGILFLEMLDDAAGFMRWFQHMLNSYFVEDVEDKYQVPSARCHIRLHHVGRPSASNALELRAECAMDVEGTLSGTEDFEIDDGSGLVPVLLVFRNVTQHRRKRVRKKPKLHRRAHSQDKPQGTLPLNTLPQSTSTKCHL